VFDTRPDNPANGFVLCSRGKLVDAVLIEQLQITINKKKLDIQIEYF